MTPFLPTHRAKLGDHKAFIPTLWNQCLEPGQQQQLLKDGDSKEIATYVWSLLHGLSTILTNQKMPPDVMGERSPRELTSDYLRLIYFGLEQG